MINRNDPCPCGSGLKFKRCCMNRAGGAGRTAQAAAAQAVPASLADADVEQLFGQASSQQRAGRLEEAIRSYRSILQRRPRHAPSLYALGTIMGQTGAIDQALRLIRQAIAADERNAQYHAHLAALLLEQGRGEEALRTVQHAESLEPRNSLVLCTAAEMLDRLNRLDEAAAVAGRAIEAGDAEGRAAIALAGIEQRRGRFAESLALVEEIVQRPGVGRPLRLRAMHLRATALDRLGRCDEAWEAFVEHGAAAAREPMARRFDRTFWQRRIDEYRRVMHERPWASATVPAGDHLRAPVFLVGFPRSGTTLLERVLEAHPRIAVSDERPVVPLMAAELSRRFDGDPDVPSLLARMDDAQRADLRRWYWQRMEQELGARPTAPIFIDKLPLNIIELGLINTVFPDARVLLALRDPRDVCLSCFFQDFRLNQAMVNFLTPQTTAEFYAHVMGFWRDLRETLTLPVLEVRYEQTVRDLEAQARRVLDFIGAEWDPAVLTFHERTAEQLISTPSAAAVREPVHTRAIDRWRNYEKQIEQTMRPALEPFL